MGTELVELMTARDAAPVPAHETHKVRFKTGVVTVVAERMAISFLQDIPFSVFDERTYQDQLSRS